ncbi:type III secretion system translocon subunit SctE [Burkholderia latens]|uniref:type III secretion system translocon subunit SctE n=1 Tax=Burkholderia latens TaxID=488446 RepID=UPI001FC8E139|nr:type III secretion system translocon subunit SctE [Burkholderia latens]
MKNAIQQDTEQLEKMAEIVPSLYSLIDKSTYQAVLESEDDALKQLGTLEQSDKSLSDAERATLEKQEAALKAQLTADFKINAHVDPWKVLEFGNLNELKLVEDVLKRVKEMAENGELDGIDKSVIDAATQALQTQAKMLEAMSHLHGIAEVTMIFGALGTVMEKNNETELNNSEHVSESQMKARQKDLQQKSDEYEKQVAKAEQMQKTMGCVGKILGLALMVAGAVGAIAGGGGVPLLVIGTALMAADQIDQAVTGTSFMAEIEQPVMDAIVKPLANLYAQVAIKALEDCGVSKEDAETAGKIIGMVCAVAAVAMVAMVAGEVVGEAVSSLVDAVAEKVAELMETMIGRVLKEGLENLVDKVGLKELSGRIGAAMGRMRKALGIDTEEGLQQAQMKIKYGEIGMRVGNDVSQGTMDVLTQNAALKADKKLRDIKMDEFDMAVLKQLMTDAIKVFADRNKALMGVLQDMSSASSIEFTTGQTILRNMARSI